MLHPISLGIPPHILRRFAEDCLSTDMTGFDVGAAVVGTRPAKVNFLAKSDLTVAGFAFAEAILDCTGCTVKWLVKEGDRVNGSAGPVPIGEASGPICRLLQAERTALEVLMRCSAVATATSACVAAAAATGWKGSIAGTRKTTPGLMRYVEKVGLAVGGADTHRFSLATCCMLKDNHVDAVGGDIAKAVACAKRVGGFTLKVEVESRSLEEARKACGAGADIVMLDNFTPEGAAAASVALKKDYPHVLVEMSGGIDGAKLPTVATALAGSGVDIVSMGCLTQSPAKVDVSFKVVSVEGA